MPCDTWVNQGQTLAERKTQISTLTKQIDAMISSGKVTVKVGVNGAVVFINLPKEERGGVTDACIYRRMMVSGSQLARQKIAQAEMLAGRGVNKQALARGVHSHDRGQTWHDHKG
jgi:hypothetical protein